MLRRARWFACVALLALPVESAERFAPVIGGQSAAEVLEAIRKVRLDPTQLYRVHDASIHREDLRIYLIEGTLAFLQPVQGKVTGAVFVGEGEVLLIPPNAVEKRSLGKFTGAPVLNEKFSSALFRFTDDTYERLRESVSNRESAEMLNDPELVGKWDPVVGNLHGLFEMRVLSDLLAEKPVPFFSGRFSGERLGAFDISVDYRLTEQLTAGQVNWKDNRRYGDVWCAFPVRSIRNGTRSPYRDPIQPVHFRIESKLLPTRSLQVQAEVEVDTLVSGERVLQFELSRFLKVASVQLVSKTAPPADVEFSQNALVDEHEMRRRGNDQVTVILPKPTAAGKRFTLAFRYEGEVISDSGNGVWFVGARGIWYPNRGFRPAMFDLTFHCPKRLTLVATGDRLEEKEEGEWRVSRWRSRTKLRVAGFNVGEYEKGDTKAAGVEIEVYANKNWEPALERQQRVSTFLLESQLHRPVIPARGNQQARQAALLPPIVAMTVPVAKAADITESIARDAASNVDFFTKTFGPLPYGRVAISPIPGNFGQGWPGLVYLSTLAFFLPYENTAQPLSKTTEIFYRSLLRSHELAHQWWGNVVVPSSYRDEWLLESLSNYAALMYLETRKNGEREVKLMLERSRDELAQKTSEEEPAERAGPPVLGYRLTNSKAPTGVDLVMYKKGTWIVHMLRQLMRDPKTGSDANFFRFLRALRDGFETKPLSTLEFRKVAEKFVVPAANAVESGTSLEWFFDQWVYSSGVPEVKVHTQIQARNGRVRVSGTINMHGVDDNFTLPVPIYAQTLKGQTLLGIVAATGRETAFNLTTTVAPTRVIADPQGTLLAVLK